MSTETTIWEWKGRDDLSKILERLRKDMKTLETNTELTDKAMKDMLKGEAGSIDYLSAKLRNLDKLHRAAFDPNDIRRYKEQIIATQRELDRLNNIGTPTPGKKGFLGMFRNGRGGNMGDFASQIPGLGMLGGAANPYVLGGMAVAGAGAAAYKAYDYSVDIDTQMAKINGTAKLSKANLQALEDQLFSMAKTAKVDFATVPDGFEKVLSATGDLNMSLEMMPFLLKASKAGFTDLTTVGEGVAQTKAILGDKATTERILDVFFAAKDFGKGEFADFSRYVPGLMAQANNLGASFEDVAGSFSFMTKSFSAETAAMLLQNVFTAFSKSDVQKGLKKQFRVNLFDKNGAMRDMADIFAELNKAMSGLSDQQRINMLEAAGLRDAQAKQGLSALLSGYRELAAGIDDVTNSQGRLNDALANTRVEGVEMMTTLTNSWQNFKNNLGTTVAPFFNSLLSGANKLLEGRTFEYARPTTGYELRKQIKGDYSSPSILDGVMKDVRSTNQWLQNNPLKLKTYVDNLSDDRRAITESYFNANRGRLAAMGLDVDSIANAFGRRKKIAAKPGTTTTEEVATVADPFGIEKTSTTGRSVRNVTVNIETLGKIENIHTTTVGQGIADVREQLTQELVRVVRDAEITLNTYGA